MGILYERTICAFLRIHGGFTLQLRLRPGFYAMLHAGHMPSTSQLNPYQYLDFFDALARQGEVLHVAFGSGMTASVKNAWEAAEEIRRKYPNRRIEVVDYAADLRDADRSLEETLAWLQENCRSVHHQFYSTDLKDYRRGGCRGRHSQYLPDHAPEPGRQDHCL